MMKDAPQDQTNHCPMCEDAAKKILELEQRVKVLTDAVAANHEWHKEMDEYGGYPDSELCEINTNALNQTPQQTAAQIERGHIEWMMKLPVVAYGDRLGTHLQQAYCIPDTGVPPWMTSMTKLVAIPPLPKESNSPETDLDEALRRQ